MFYFPEITNIILCTPDNRLLLTKYKHGLEWSFTIEQITCESKTMENVVYEKLGLVVPKKSNNFMDIIKLASIKTNNGITVSLYFLKLLSITNIQVSKKTIVKAVKWKDIFNDVKFDFSFIDYEFQRESSSNYTTNAIIAARELHHKGIMPNV